MFWETGNERTTRRKDLVARARAVSGTASANAEVVVQVSNPDGVLVSTGQTTADNAGNYEVTAMRFPLEESELFPLR